MIVYSLEKPCWGLMFLNAICSIIYIAWRNWEETLLLCQMPYQDCWFVEIPLFPRTQTSPRLT